MHAFDTTGPVTIALEIPAGTIHLHATDQPETTIEIQPADPGNKRDAKAAEHTHVEHHDGVIQITTTDPNRILGHSGSLNITITLPTGSRFTGKAGAAALHTTGHLDEITFDGGHHTIEIDEATTTHLTMHTGTIHLNRLTGPAHIDNGTGDITIDEAHTGTLTLRTGTGNLTITTAPHTNATLDASTPYGRIHNTLTNTQTPNPTTLHIQATTNQGDITATSR